MFRFAKEYIINEEDSENIVQDIFLHILEKRDVLKIQTNLSCYLFTLLKNKCIDHLRHKVIIDQFKNEYKAKLYSLDIFEETVLSEDNLEKIIVTAIEKLPKRCRRIFIKNRFEGKKYHEIASEMGISVNTVENQISIALKKLRIELKDYLPFLFFML
jgi:RNA polymerase sigma-70 factor (ECF subfamily)